MERSFDQAPARGLAILKYLLLSMRPRQWVTKNIFVFPAIVFSEQRLWTRPASLLAIVLAFVAFSMAAGAIYLMNDLVDIEKDRAHPKKRHRPLASGRLSQPLAWVVAILLIVLVLPASFWLDAAAFSGQAPDTNFGWAILAYIVIQGVAYSYYLKHVVILDVFTIAAGFVLRTVAGALVLDIPITPWLLVCMGLLALFLGLGKRRSELTLLAGGAGSHRPILTEYSLPMIDQLISMVNAGTIIAYTLFTFTAETLPLRPYPVMIVTIPFVVYAIFRYTYLVYVRGGGGEPTELLLKDIPLAASVMLWGLTVLGLLFFFPGRI